MRISVISGEQRSSEPCNCVSCPGVARQVETASWIYLTYSHTMSRLITTGLDVLRIDSLCTGDSIDPAGQ